MTLPKFLVDILSSAGIIQDKVVCSNARTITNILSDCFQMNPAVVVLAGIGIIILSMILILKIVNKINWG